MMQRYSKTTAILLIASAFQLAGCATEQHARNSACPPNKTLVCNNRMGQDQECQCHSKATMRDVFDLRHSK